MRRYIATGLALISSLESANPNLGIACAPPPVAQDSIENWSPRSSDSRSDGRSSLSNSLYVNLTLFPNSPARTAGQAAPLQVASWDWPEASSNVVAPAASSKWSSRVLPVMSAFPVSKPVSTAPLSGNGNPTGLTVLKKIFCQFALAGAVRVEVKVWGWEGSYGSIVCAGTHCT